MPGPADLVIRILADTSGAQSNVNALISTLGKAAGVGAGAGVAGSMVAASMQVQDAMARVQASYNSADFAPGTQKFNDAQNSILRFSTTTATSFNDAAAVYAQGTRFIDDAGKRLDPGKLDEYTDTMLRLSKVSTDHLAPEDIGQQVDVLAKLFGTSDFSKLGSEISGLSGMHNQGEGPGLQAAISIGQVGADIGVTQEQALALGNYLADLQLGGQMGGGSIGRMLQRMNAGVDKELASPEEKYSQVKKDRSAGEHLDDLQNQLAVAEQRHKQMYGQHGLKTAYKHDPAALMASNNEIAKLQREIGDQQQDMAHLHDDASKPTASVANVGAMAELVGADKTAYAQQFQSDPMATFLQWTHAVGQLPENQRLSAITKAFAGRGRTNTQDMRIIEALANPARQGTLESYFTEVGAQAASPTDLAARSNIPLGTTSSKVTNASNALYGQAAAAGEGPRQAIDAVTTDLLKAYADNTTAIRKLDDTLAGSPLLGIITTGVVAGVTTALPIIATRALMGGGASAVARGGAAAVSGAASTAAGSGAIGTAVGGGGFLDVAGPALALAAPFILAKTWKDQHPDSSFVPVDDAGAAFAQRHPIGSVPESGTPQTINVGGVQIHVPGGALPDWSTVKDSLMQEMAQQLQMAWTAATQGSPVSGGAMGGAYITGSAPR